MNITNRIIVHLIEYALFHMITHDEQSSSLLLCKILSMTCNIYWIIDTVLGPLTRQTKLFMKVFQQHLTKFKEGAFCRIKNLDVPNLRIWKLKTKKLATSNDDNDRQQQQRHQQLEPMYRTHITNFTVLQWTISHTIFAFTQLIYCVEPFTI